MDWDDYILGYLNISKEVLPKVKSSNEVYGHVDSHTLGGSKLTISEIAQASNCKNNYNF